LSQKRADSGSIAPYGLALLVLILSIVFGLGSSAHAALHASRLQNLADAAVLFAHDRSESEIELQLEVERFLKLAVDSQTLARRSVTIEVTRSNGTSELKLCSAWQNPFALTQPRPICRSASARAFEKSD
jgi:hypothetical protein